jgi:hypothetical protein
MEANDQTGTGTVKIMENVDHLHFSDYLNRLPGNLVFERFVKGSAQGRKIVSASTIKDVVVRFAGEKSLKDTFSRLSRDAGYFISLAYLFGRRGLSFDQVGRPEEKSGRRGEGGVGREVKAGNAGLPWEGDELLNSFLVYAAKDDQGKRYYVGFDEFEPFLRTVLAHAIVEKIRTPQQKDGHFFPPELCSRDIAMVVALASQEKLTKTKTGQLSKASDLAVDRLLHGAHSSFDSVAGFARPILLGIEYAHRKGLIALHGEKYLACHEKMSAWMARPAQDLASDFVAFAFSSQPLWRKSMVNEMLSVADNPWLCASSFGTGMKNETTAAVKLFAYLGLVEYCKIGGDYLFRGPRRAPPGRNGISGDRQTQSATVIIVPDFSVMLSQEITPEALYWFSKIGTLESLDKVYKGKISKEVLCDSLAAGISAEKLLELLGNWRCPGNVLETAKEWIREFSRVFMETGAIVVSSEEKVTKQLRAYGPLAQCLSPVPAHCIFKVIKGKEDTVAALLAEMGFDPRSPLQKPSEASGERQGDYGSLVKNESKLAPIFDYGEDEENSGCRFQQGKYSSQMKALEPTELIHVIDFSLLMGCNLRIEYNGSPGVRKGVYLVHPLQCHKSPQPLLEAESGRTSVKKAFLLERIAKIGVEPDHE